MSNIWEDSSTCKSAKQFTVNLWNYADVLSCLSDQHLKFFWPKTEFGLILVLRTVNDLHLNFTTVPGYSL